MSGAENEAVEAALPVVRRQLGWVLNRLADDAEATCRQVAQEIHDAMRRPIEQAFGRDLAALLDHAAAELRRDIDPTAALGMTAAAQIVRTCADKGIAPHARASLKTSTEEDQP